MKPVHVTVFVVALVACDRSEVSPAASSTVASTKVTIADTVATPDTAHVVDKDASAATSTIAVSTGPGDSLTRVHFSSPQDSICGEVAENGFNIPNPDRRGVAAQFGRPDSVRANPAPNPHNPAQIDTIVDVFYHGIRLQYWAVNATPSYDLLLKADVSDNKYLKFPRLGIGATTGEITSALGEPHERTEDTFNYSCALHIMSGTDVTFHFAGGRVTRVDYLWEAD